MIDAPATNLDELLASGRSDAAALVDPTRGEMTFAQLAGAVDHLARQCAALGIDAGDAVAIAMPNGPAIVVAFFAVARARATAAPLNPAYTRDEFAFYLEDIGPKMLLVPAGSGDAARAAAAYLGIRVGEIVNGPSGMPSIAGAPTAQLARTAEPDDVALFLHTSGTTSRPKGVPLTHANLCASAQNIAAWYELSPDDVSLCVMPLFHIHGLVFSTLAHLRAGAAVVLPERFSASAFWNLVRERRVTVVSAVPTIYRTLLLRADDDDAPRAGGHTLRFLRSSSSALPEADLHRLEERFGAPVIEAYSMTEAAHQMCANPLAGPRKPGSVGVGARVDVAIMSDDGTLLPTGSEGEIVVRGPNVTRGYHNNPAANAAAFTNGWFRTGDRGTLDADGYLRLVGRIKELINRGGEKISPLEIDAALAQHPGVVEGVSFGIPDEKYGEEVAAALVLRDGITTESVAAYLGERLASFKIPKRFFVTTEIPKTATGKLQRRIVAAAFTEPKP